MAGRGLGRADKSKPGGQDDPGEELSFDDLKTL